MNRLFPSHVAIRRTLAWNYFDKANLEIIEMLLSDGANPNKTIGLSQVFPGEYIVTNKMCTNLSHKLQQFPKAGCNKCLRRAVWLEALLLLRKYGGTEYLQRNSETNIGSITEDVQVWQD